MDVIGGLRVCVPNQSEQPRNAGGNYEAGNIIQVVILGVPGESFLAEPVDLTGIIPGRDCCC